MRKIESVNNEYVKELAKLKNKKYRDAKKMFLVEGYHLVNEAKEKLVEVLIVDEKDKIEGIENILVNKEIIKKISTTDSPQPIIGICKYFEESNNDYGKKIVVLDDLQDPGNVGTIIRSALGFGVDSVVLSNNSVDIYNEKVIRATQGAIFKVKVFRENIINTIEKVKNEGIKVYGTSLENGNNLNSFEKTNQYCLVLGNEGNGVSKEILDICDENIFIEMNKELESLNVAIAGAIIMHYFY